MSKLKSTDKVEKCDLIVIGSGPGGQKAALQAAKVGKKVVLIERDAAVGGGCVHLGTLPSKSFRESIYRWSMGSQGVLGQELEHVGAARKKSDLPDIKRLLKRKSRVVSSEARVVFDQLSRNGIRIVHGVASFVDPHTIEVSGENGVERIWGSTIVIAVGARPFPPSHIKVDGKRILDSDSVLSLKELPRSMVVLGGGIIGCEYASMFSMAGTRVTLVDKRHEILASVDRDIVACLMDRFEHQGVEFVLDCESEEIQAEKDQVRVKLSNGRRVAFDCVLVALGRMGNTEGLGLERIGVVANDRNQVKVDAHFRTSVPHIYAVGDVIGAPALASTSMEQGRVAVCHAFKLEQYSRGTMPEHYPFGIYTIPEISMIGPTEEALRQNKTDYVVGVAHYRELARGQIVGDRWGLLKLLVDRKSYRLLGVHIVGDGAADLIHIGQAVMAFGGTIDYFIQNVFNYPTLAEAYKTAAFHALNLLNKRK